MEPSGLILDYQFGLRLAPMIFPTLTDALQWSFLQSGVSWVGHYLDDFIGIGPPGFQECHHNLDIMLASCRRLGVPIAPAKCAPSNKNGVLRV